MNVFRYIKIVHVFFVISFFAVCSQVFTLLYYHNAYRVGWQAMGEMKVDERGGIACLWQILFFFFYRVNVQNIQIVDVDLRLDRGSGGLDVTS
jgi:uncharacterized membrane protein